MKTKQEAASVQLRLMKQTRRTIFDETSYVYGICCIVMSHYQMVPPSPKFIHPFANRSSSCSPLEKQLVLQLQLLEDLLLEVICRLTTPPKKVAFWYFHIFFISSCYLQRFFRTGVHHHATFKLHHCKKQDKIRRRGRTGIGKSPNCAIFGVGLTLGHGPWVCSNQLLSIHVDTTNHLMGMSISHSTLFRY